MRSIILCRACWNALPNDAKFKAYQAAKEDRQSIHIGETAMDVLVTLRRLS